jgi:tetratricopeptide (TPR) repeat protein
VLFYYLRLFFLPSLAELSLYHDDFQISTGLLQPATTLCAFVGLALITVICWRLRKKCPPLWFAWGWFLLSHALESTVVSLELVHEHRNYFATFGFVVLLPWLIGQLSSRIRRPALAGFALFFVLCSFITWQRSIVWGSPLEHATFEADNHPRSERARYQLGYAYTLAYRATNDKEFLQRSIAEMRAAAQTGREANGALFALLHLAWRAEEPVDPQVLSQLKKNLREKPGYNGNATFLSNLADCQMKAACHFPPEEIVELFQAAIENPRTANDARAVMLAKLATYYLAVFSDAEKAEAALRQALELDEDAKYHLLLVELDLMLEKWQDARQHLDAAVRLNGRQRWSGRIARFQKALDEAAPQDKAKAP